MRGLAPPVSRRTIRCRHAGMSLLIATAYRFQIGEISRRNGLALEVVRLVNLHSPYLAFTYKWYVRAPGRLKLQEQCVQRVQVNSF